MKSTVFAPLALWIFVTVGCMKPVPQRPSSSPAPTAGQKAPPFKIDSAPSALTGGCETDRPDDTVCGKNRQLLKAQQDLRDLHRDQKKVMVRALKKMHFILNRSDSRPTVRISANPIDTNSWVDPAGTYPAELVVRAQYSRGLKYLGPTAVDDMKSALGELQQVSKNHSAQWREAYSKVPRGLVLSEEILSERRPIDVRFQLTDETVNLVLPRMLAQQYLTRDVSPWDAVAAHVVEESGKKYTMLNEHRHPLASALTVTAGKSIQITELVPGRDRVKFVSYISPVDACKGLRGEIRFVRRDALPSLRAVFVPVPQDGGGR